MKIIEYGKQNSEIIILLHGGGLSWWNYRSEAQLLDDRYHVVLPVLDGHADSDALLIGGLSLGAQILVEMLSQRGNICQYAIIESASIIPSRVTNAMIGPAFSSSYSLIRKRWFAQTQFRYLRIRDDLFEDYYRDTTKISKENMISFLKANTGYAMKPALRNCQAQVRIIAGGKEQKGILRSAQLLHNMLPGSTLEIKNGLFHGEYSINHPDQYTADLLMMLKTI